MPSTGPPTSSACGMIRIGRASAVSRLRDPDGLSTVKVTGWATTLPRGRRAERLEERFRPAPERVDNGSEAGRLVRHLLHDALREAPALVPQDAALPAHLGSEEPDHLLHDVTLAGHRLVVEVVQHLLHDAQIRDGCVHVRCFGASDV